MNVKAMLERAAASAANRKGMAPSVQVQEQDPRAVLAGIIREQLGLAGVHFQIMGLSFEPCLCGECSGVRAYFNAAFHMPHGKPPEFFPRDRPQAKQPPAAPEEKAE